MIRVFFAWAFMLLTSFVVIMLVNRIDFFKRMFLEGVNPFVRGF